MTEHKHLSALSGMIASKKATVGIFGVGYVGLPLACAFAEAGFKTIACDTNVEKISAIRKGMTYVEDDYVGRLLPHLVGSKTLEADHDTAHVASIADFEIITVPTPLNQKREPDLSYVTAVSRTIADKIRPGKFVILESSVYPGTTDEVVKPILESRGLRAGRDFGLAHSPERIDYNNPKYSILEIPKVVGGVTPLCTQIASELYAKILHAPVVPVSDARTAEATKMLENTYRYVNIALVNELAIFHEKLGVDFFEVIAAASTKPFGFQPFYPGPGVGGHCIPKDPHYLAYKAHQVGVLLRMVELSTEINEGMSNHIVDRLENDLSARGKSLRGSKVALLGLAFKADVSDTRRSPSIVLAERLMDLGAHVSAYDPLVESVLVKEQKLLSSANLENAVEKATVLILVTPHKSFKEIDLKKMGKHVEQGAAIFDTRGFWSRSECEAAGFHYLGLGRP